MATNQPQPRVMAIDYGEARIGLALSDELGLLAHPLETVPGDDKARAAARIVQLVEEKGVGTLLIGLPLRMDGSEGSAVEKVRAFEKRLRAGLPEAVEIIEVDERLSTVAAMAKLHEAGRTVKNSRDRIDQAAAMEILQEYLDMKAGAGLLPDDLWEEEEDLEG
ncbi:MAG: Holliday junction resolvase RuvX [Verrucomicrobiae bacterium]|nr:Holliday junction resolvase RuvX [Verrucomicrobiae bacterium]MCB1090729.1 Holliday junction resolvase RuvX [Verrucomicrobiae bacterium]